MQLTIGALPCSMQLQYSDLQFDGDRAPRAAVNWRFGRYQVDISGSDEPGNVTGSSWQEQRPPPPVVVRELFGESDGESDLVSQTIMHKADLSCSAQRTWNSPDAERRPDRESACASFTYTGRGLLPSSSSMNGQRAASRTMRWHIGRRAPRDELVSVCTRRPRTWHTCLSPWVSGTDRRSCPRGPRRSPAHNRACLPEG